MFQSSKNQQQSKIGVKIAFSRSKVSIDFDSITFRVFGETKNKQNLLAQNFRPIFLVLDEQPKQSEMCVCVCLCLFPFMLRSITMLSQHQ